MFLAQEIGGMNGLGIGIITGKLPVLVSQALHGFYRTCIDFILIDQIPLFIPFHLLRQPVQLCDDIIPHRRQFLVCIAAFCFLRHIFLINRRRMI